MIRVVLGLGVAYRFVLCCFVFAGYFVGFVLDLFVVVALFSWLVVG